jgi:rhodanese-related sulfurtransferase
MPALPSRSPVTDFPASRPADAQQHFARLLELETDCWDVHASLEAGTSGFVLLDVRSPEHFRRGHVEGAVNLPHGRISERVLEEFPREKLLVVYCSGPHCNGADRAALKLASLGRPVKKMIGGVTGWIDEGFPLTGDER